MALQTCGLHRNNTQKELSPHGTAEFPCGAYDSYYGNTPDTVVPWHWHEEFEIVLIKEGTLILKAPTKTIQMKEGEMAIINANVTHYAEGAPLCRLQSLVFSPLLLAGNSSSAIYKKYLLPLIEFKDFVCIHITTGKQEAFSKAFDALKSDEPFYEFIVRDQLSQIMIAVYSLFKDYLTDNLSSSGIDNDRIKEMLEFIHFHYKENIPLSDICKAGNIGEREALRCFKRTIGESPIQYLLKYRLIQSAKMLLSHPEKDISEIAGICGFNSLSYFSKKFKELYLCTPGSYRKSRQKLKGETHGN